MKRKNVTRNALFTSIISLLLCVSMLVGTTFAWFTDEVTSGINTITAGNLDVELYHGKTPDPTTKVGKDTKLFTDTKDVEIELWEPGVVAYTNLKVANEGNLALKYQMALNFEEATATADGKTLADVLKVAVVEDGVKGTTRETVLEEAKRSANQFTLDTFYLAEKLEKAENSETYGLVIYWEPDTDYTDGNTDNLYNMNNGETTVLSIKLGIHLFATQLEMEEDSFGPDYDENLWDDAMVVLSEEDLIAALAAGETAIKLDDNITVDGPLVIPEGNTVALDLNGMDLSTTDPATGYAINNLGTLTLMDSQAGASTFNSRSIKARGIYNGYNAEGNHVTTAKLTILSGEYNAMGTNGGAAVYNYGTVEIKGGTFTSNGGYALNNQKTGKMTVSNASVTGGIYNLGELTVNNSKVYQHLSGRHAIYNYEAKLVINSGEFDSESGNELILADGQKSSVVINGGTFDKTAKSWLFGAATGKDISFVINGGVFNGYVNMPENTVDTIRPYGDPIVVTGGTFNFDPTSWVAAGYKAVNVNGTYHVVPNDITLIYDTASLNAALVDGANKVQLLDGNYEADLYNISGRDSLTITGNGAGTKLNFKKGQVRTDLFKELTIENCTIGRMVDKSWGQLVFSTSNVAGGVYTISNCIVDGQATQGIYINQSKVDATYNILNCTFNGDFGNEGAITIQDNDCEFTVNVTDCEFNNIPETSHEIWAATSDPATKVEYGTWKLYVDGELVAVNAAQMANAVDGGATKVLLTAGEYKMPSSGTTGEVTITGTKDVVLDMTMGAYMENANVTIEGVTIKTGTGMVNGNGSDYAALYTPNVTYTNCTFVGPLRVGRDGAKFINCTFTELGNDYVWTYGNDVTFEGCTFNTDGKAILIYSDGGNEVAKVSVKNCVFNSTQGAKAGAIVNQNCAAIEIHNYGNGVNLTTSGNTYDSNFSGEWRIKTYEAGRTQIIVNDTEYTTIALDGKTMSIDADKNVTVNP